MALRRFPHRTSFRVYRAYKVCGRVVFCSPRIRTAISQAYRLQIFCEGSHSFVFTKASIKGEKNFCVKWALFPWTVTYTIDIIHSVTLTTMLVPTCSYDRSCCEEVACARLSTVAEMATIKNARDEVVLLSLRDYEKLFAARATESLELLRSALKRPTRPPLPRSEVYLDGRLTCSGDYVVSPLYISLQREWLDVFQYLLALCPAIVNKLLPTVKVHDTTDAVYCSNSETLLHLACRKELVEVIQYLLDRGASMKIRGCKVGTALHVAAEHGKLRAVALLLDSGADIEAHDDSGNTPLLAAASKSASASVQLLLHRGANIEAKSYFGHGFFSLATKCFLMDLLEDHAFSYNNPSTPPPILQLAAIASKSFAYSWLVKKVADHPNCPPHLRVDTILISASCSKFSSESVERFKTALRLKQDLQTGLPAVTSTSSWYGEHHEVSSVQEWEEMQPGPQDYYLQGCLILERCLGSDHPIFYEHLFWLLFFECNISSKLSLKCLDMFVTREQMKLKYCKNAVFDVSAFNTVIGRISKPSFELCKVILKGFEVFVKLQERHTTCTFFKTEPTPRTAHCIFLMSTFLNCLQDWIVADDLHHKAALETEDSTTVLTQFREAVKRFVELSHSALHGRSVFSIVWWPLCFHNETEQILLVFILSTLLQTEAVSRINTPDPRRGVRPLHYFKGLLGKTGVTLLLSYGAHLDVASRRHPTLLPGRYPLNTKTRKDDVDRPCSPVVRWALQEAAVVPDIPVDTQLSSPLPLLCQCSRAILREKIPYHQFHLPSQIKEYIALHETN